MANASTWGLVTFAIPSQQLRNGGNSVLVDAITQIGLRDRQERKEWLTRLKMRKAPRNQGFRRRWRIFVYHGRLIPTRYLSTGTYSNRGPKLFKPGENKMPYNLGFSTDQQLVKVEDDEGYSHFLRWECNQLSRKRRKLVAFLACVLLKRAHGRTLPWRTPFTSASSRWETLHHL